MNDFDKSCFQMTQEPVFQKNICPDSTLICGHIVTSSLNLTHDRLVFNMLNRKVYLNTLCEFGPIIVFIAVYTFSDFEQATLAMIIAVLGALVLLKITEGHVPLFAIISTLAVALFGGISLFVEMPSLFILRDTIFDIIFGIALLWSAYIQKPLLQPFFKNVFALTNQGWIILSQRWGIFFILLGIINEWVRLSFTADTWVLVKIGMIIVTFLFGVYQFTLSKRERLPDATDWGLVK